MAHFNDVDNDQVTNFFDNQLFEADLEAKKTQLTDFYQRLLFKALFNENFLQETLGLNDVLLKARSVVRND